LKKRSKKLFPGASHEASISSLFFRAFIWAADPPHEGAGEEGERVAPGKSLLVLFFRKELLFRFLR
jgi:hypothetical protein